jgi:hypothetical protein
LTGAWERGKGYSTAQGSKRRGACLERVIVVDIGWSACVVAGHGVLVWQRRQIVEHDVALLQSVGTH